MFTVNNQRFNCNVIQDVVFSPKAKDAFRAVLNDLRGMDLAIMTSNERANIDVGVRSRCAVPHVPPCEPHVFVQRAKAAIEAVGFNVDDDTLMDALDAVYEVKPDNRLHYQKIDELLRKV